MFRRHAAIVVVVLALASACSSGGGEPEPAAKDNAPPLPADQAAVVSIAQAGQNYSDTLPADQGKRDADDVQAEVLVKRNADMCALLAGKYSVVDWVGTVSPFSGTGSGLGNDGKVNLQVDMAKQVAVATHVSDLSDEESTRLGPEHPSFAVAKDLGSGDTVRFSGSFFPDKETCLYDNNLFATLRIFAPNWLFRFTKVERI